MAIPARGCMMCHSLYVKANGEMPCWDDIGETLILRTLDESALQNNRELPIFHGSELRGIVSIDGIAPGAITATVRSAPVPSAWLSQPLRQTWLADPLVLDCAFHGRRHCDRTIC